MKIAVASQNRKTITGHAGKCRKFWIYELTDNKLRGKTLLELPKERSFHESHGRPHPLDDAQALICGGMGQGMLNRLKAMGTEGLATTETDPDRAVAAYLAGTLPLGEPEAQGDHEHAHHHGHPHHAEPIHMAGTAIPNLKKMESP